MELTRDQISISAQRDFIYARTIVRAVHRVRFAKFKLVSIVALPEELIADVGASAGLSGVKRLLRCARYAVRDAIMNPLLGPVEKVGEGEACTLHAVDEFPALQALCAELLLPGSERRADMQLSNLPRCPPAPGDTDAPSVITSVTGGSPNVADSAASSSTSTPSSTSTLLSGALVGMLP